MSSGDSPSLSRETSLSDLANISSGVSYVYNLPRNPHTRKKGWGVTKRIEAESKRERRVGVMAQRGGSVISKWTLVLIRLNLLARQTWASAGTGRRDAHCLRTPELFWRAHLRLSPFGAEPLDHRTFACVPVSEHLGTESAPKAQQ